MSKNFLILESLCYAAFMRKIYVKFIKKRRTNRYYTEKLNICVCVLQDRIVVLLNIYRAQLKIV